MTSSPYALFDTLGCTRATMVGTEGRQAARWSQSQKAGLSSDCSLQLDCMKLESLVIAGTACRGEYVPGLVHTARQARKVGEHPKSASQPSGGSRLR